MIEFLQECALAILFAIAEGFSNLHIRVKSECF